MERVNRDAYYEVLALDNLTDTMDVETGNM